MPTSSLSIGVLSARSGCSVPTIRYYEQIGLLPAALRNAGGQRHYRELDVQRLQFVKHCRDLGFPIDQVRALVERFEDGDGNCAQVRDLTQAQLVAVRARLEELRMLEASLATFVEGCERGCLGGLNRDCCIIEDIGSTELRRNR